MDDRLRSNSFLNPSLDEHCYMLHNLHCEGFSMVVVEDHGWHVSVCFVYFLSKLLFPKRDMFARSRTRIRFADASPIKSSR